MYETIRRNASKKIAAILSGAALIRQFRYDDMGDDNRVATADEVLAAGREFEFDRIVANDGEVRFSIHRNWSFVAYDSVETARRNLTPFAFAKYFPGL